MLEIEAGAQQPAPTRSPSAAKARIYFIDLKDGATIPPRSRSVSGSRTWRSRQQESVKPNTGHHHLLIDTPLPPLDQPIPSDFNHIHFGAGQTEAEITLPAGEHTLQLLLGDHAHIPHNPPVVSDVIRIRVDAATVEKTRTPAPAGASVSLIEPADGATVGRNVKVKFGVSGMDLAPAGTSKPNSGHHHLLIDTPLPALDREIPSDLNHLHFGRAQTETEITLAPGDHTLQLLLGDHEHLPHDPAGLLQGHPHPRRECRAGKGGAGRAQGQAASPRRPTPPSISFIRPRAKAFIRTRRYASACATWALRPQASPSPIPAIITS